MACVRKVLHPAVIWDPPPELIFHGDSQVRLNTRFLRPLGLPRPARKSTRRGYPVSVEGPRAQAAALEADEDGGGVAG